MTGVQKIRGSAPVGLITDLDALEATSVIYFRMWCEGAARQEAVWHDFVSRLDQHQTRDAIEPFEQLCRLCVQYGRRPMMRHSIACKCLGADESCFAHFIAAAAAGEREDAMLIATLLVRPDFAPLITSLAADFGLAIRRRKLCLRHDAGGVPQPDHSRQTTLH